MNSGEAGGKDFIFAHSSANVDRLVTAMIRGAFEYAGQKCSAASRAYIPASLWPAVQKKLLHGTHITNYSSLFRYGFRKDGKSRKSGNIGECSHQ